MNSISRRQIFLTFLLATLTLSVLYVHNVKNVRAAGIDSNIKYLFVVEMSHLDIGFTDPPDEVAEFYKWNIDHAMAICHADPDYKWTIEEIWQLEQWMARSSSSEINDLKNLVKQGRIGLTAGYATMHSGVLGHEEINRFLYPAKEISEAWNISIETIIQDDVPGYSWALPQVLNKSNVKYMVTGINTWADLGKPSIPMSDIPFYWQGPDGSKVLTWISFGAYIEGFFDYGLTNLANAFNTLSSKLPQLESEGYPYNATLVLRAGDNQDTDLTMTNLARQWNNTYDNPKIVLAHPEDFFKYLEENYGSNFPTYSGDWTSWWDILGITQPQSITKNRWAHDNILSAEKLSTINQLLGTQTYPMEDIELAYKKMMEFDEHMTGGAPWPGLMTSEETQRQNEILCGYASTAYNKTTEVLDTALETLAGNVRSDNQSIIVFNPLSWNRTDIVKAELSNELFSQPFNLIDSETGLPVPYQKLSDVLGDIDYNGIVDIVDIVIVALAFGSKPGDPNWNPDADLNNDDLVDIVDIVLVAIDFGELVTSKQIMFVARDIPSIGYKRYEINISQWGEIDSGSVNVSGNVIENQFYEITFDESDGHIVSIYDKEADRELVNGLSEFEFNQAIKCSNDQLWSGLYSDVPTGTCTVTVGLNGPVAKSISVNRNDSPFVKTEVILYDGIKRIDLVNIMNRDLMEWVDYTTGLVYYAYTFPFNLSNFNVKLEIANAFMTPEVDNLPDANVAYFTTQHGLEMFEADYGITWASKETFIHEFEGINLYATTFSPAEATLVSRFLKKEDEGKFIGGSIGPIEQEPGASPILGHTYSFTSHAGPFDPVNTSQFVWAHSNPLLAKETSSNPDGVLTSPSMSFFDVNSSNVMIVNVKKANFGDDYIFRLQEIEGMQTTVKLNSPYFNISQATLTNNVEEDIEGLPIEGGDVIASVNSLGTITIRLKFGLSP